MLIGFFDSGIGGLTVLRDALKVLPNTDYLYYGDTKNVPYGPKTREQVRECIFDAVDFIVRKGVDAIVIACNTATSVAIEDLRKRYAIPIIGMEPAVKPAVENHLDKRILVTATALALKEDKLKRLITRLNAEDIVDLLPLPGLVAFAEKFVFDEQAVMPYLKDALSPYDMRNYKTVVLGCTHFIYYKDFFKKMLPNHVDIIDGNCGTVKMLVRTLTDLGVPEAGTGKVTYYHSGTEVTDSGTLQIYSNLLNHSSAAHNS
jgi:glutamate racemase